MNTQTNARKPLESGPTYETHYRPDKSSGYSITCKICGLTSYHPDDVSNRYCGHCHKWHDDLAGQDANSP